MAREIPDNSTPIINEIIEKLASTRLSTNEFNIVMAIIRKTYGWDKKEDYISGSQLSILTGIHAHHCYRILKKLMGKRIVNKNGTKIGLNKKTVEWLVPIQVVPGQVVKYTRAGTKKDTSLGTYKRNRKETYTKEIVPNGTTAEPREYGNPEINKVLKAIQLKVGVDDFRESKKQQRFWGLHLLNLMRKVSPQEFGRRLGVILSEEFKRKNCGSLKYIHREIKAFIEPNSLITMS